nr:helix-turn-helix transcriptional regulator [Fusobacterium gastrosuis]
MNNIEIIIKTLMEMNNLTQVDFAIKTEIPLPTIRKYLKSEFNPTEKNIEKIKNAFNIRLNILLDSDLKNIETIEDVKYSLSLELKELNEEIEKCDIDISIGEYSGHLKHLDYDPFLTLEISTDIKKIVENTLNFIDFLIKKHIEKEEEFLIKKNLIKKTELSKNEKLIEILKSHNIVFNFEKDSTIIIFDNEKYSICNDKLNEILKIINKTLDNDFKNLVNLLNTNKK